MIKIAVDAMGGDNAPEITVKGAIEAIQGNKNIEITLFGDVDKITPFLSNSERITIVDTKEFIPMGEHDPISNIRKNPNTSLALAFKACKDGLADCCISAGPTQAVVVGAHLIVKKLKSMHRVALAPVIPSYDGKGKILLDVGANVELRSEHILELAQYANCLARVVLHTDNPKIGLINIGTEPGKGREVDKQSYELLSKSNLNFIGNVEPKEMLLSEADVLVTDGFTGNILMKTVEGTAKVSGKMLKDEIKKTLFGKIGYLFMKKNLNEYKKRLSSDEVGGAMICGLSVPIVKAHGSSDAYAFKNAIRTLVSIVEGKVIEEVNKALAQEGEDNDKI